MNSLSDNRRPTVIGIGGLTSEVGKTTLLCKLLSAFPGWEAIKTTRGHYRSCGKDPHMCCVSDLLSEEPVVRSGRESTYAPGKDTGRYWEAGAANVHWVIATNEQVDEGINEALGRVKADGVFVEGNSFTEFVKPDFFVMVARLDQTKIKPTARRAFNDVSAIYLSGSAENGGRLKVLMSKSLRLGTPYVPIFSAEELPKLIELLRANVAVAVAGEGKQIITLPHLRPA
jgi:molybdopterin-guanine dinucleotide biosynthesis protein